MCFNDHVIENNRYKSTGVDCQPDNQVYRGTLTIVPGNLDDDGDGFVYVNKTPLTKTM